jgi:hypothetical protein
MPGEAARAAAALERAGAMPGLEGKCAERVRLVRTMFPLIHKCVDQYWAMRRLTEGGLSAPKAVAEARRVVKLREEIAGYINTVLEPAEGKPYRLFRRPTRRRQNPLYVDLMSPAPGARERTAIGAGVRAATAALREEKGAEEAEAWWSERIGETESDFLKQIFQTARLQAKGVEIVNLASDPGFEKIGEKLGAGEWDPEQDASLNRKQQLQSGFRVWFHKRSPYKVSLTGRDVHSGKYALLIEGCHRGRLSRYAKPKDGARYRVGFWIRRGPGKGAYKMIVAWRDANRKDHALAAVPVPAVESGWEEVAVDVAPPKEARLLLINFFVRGMDPEARICVDDMMIGEYRE